jgi:hypothetical protein
VRGDEMAIRHEEGLLVVKAVRASGGGVASNDGGAGARDETGDANDAETAAATWTLELEDSVDNRFTTVRPMGAVSGEERAADELVAFAELVNELQSNDEEFRPGEIVREVECDG